MTLGNGIPFCQPDSIPPPPPGWPAMLNGPASACTGETSVYDTEVPVACFCQWAVNGTIQPDTGSTFSITWEQPGSYIVTVLFFCAGGQTTEPEAILTEVAATPDVFLGNDTILPAGQTILLDAGNPGSAYLWSTGATTQTIVVSATGTYSVTVSNGCGEDQDTIAVSVMVGNSEHQLTDSLRIIPDGRNLIIRGPEKAIHRIELFDLNGRSVCSGKSAKDITIPQPGVYIVKISTPRAIHTRKLFCP